MMHFEKENRQEQYEFLGPSLKIFSSEIMAQEMLENIPTAAIHAAAITFQLLLYRVRCTIGQGIRKVVVRDKTCSTQYSKTSEDGQ